MPRGTGPLPSRLACGVRWGPFGRGGNRRVLVARWRRADLWGGHRFLPRSWMALFSSALRHERQTAESDTQRACHQRAGPTRESNPRLCPQDSSCHLDEIARKQPAGLLRSEVCFAQLWCRGSGTHIVIRRQEGQVMIPGGTPTPRALVGPAPPSGRPPAAARPGPTQKGDRSGRGPRPSPARGGSSS